MSFAPKSNQVQINGDHYSLTAFYFPGHNTAWDNYYNASFLGNFWEEKLSLTINGIHASFHTAEAAFQSTKWWSHDSIRKQFEKTLTGDDAFQLKKRITVSPDYSYAGLQRDGAMMTVVKAKFLNIELKNGLIATGDAYLLEHNAHQGLDTYWSDNKDGSGENVLGKTLMQLRADLGGSGIPYNGPVIDMTNNVLTSTNVESNLKAKSRLKIIPSVFHKGGQEGDFDWMIKQDKYKSAFFIFNDNESQFKLHLKNPSDPNGCSIGGGNAKIRPYQCQTPPKAGGIPTGPNFTGLTEEVKSMIDTAIIQIKEKIRLGGYTEVIYSSDGHGSLGTGIFHVPNEVKNYIVAEIEKL